MEQLFPNGSGLSLSSPWMPVVTAHWNLGGWREKLAAINKTQRLVESHALHRTGVERITAQDPVDLPAGCVEVTLFAGQPACPQQEQRIAQDVVIGSHANDALGPAINAEIVIASRAARPSGTGVIGVPVGGNQAPGVSVRPCRIFGTP